MKWMATVIAALAVPVMATSAAQAGISAGAAGVRNLATENAPVERVQYLYGGQNYCWYDTGWQGPGWYWCGYAWRSGLGWGGGYGWRNWAWRGNSMYWRGGRYYHGGWHGGGGGYYHGGGGR